VHQHRHRTAQGAPETDPTNDLDAVLLDRHALAPAMTEAAPRQLRGEPGGVDLEPGRQSLDDGDQRRPCATPGSESGAWSHGTRADG
jgi:hypothetical protein